MTAYTAAPERRYRALRDATGMSAGDLVKVAPVLRHLAENDDATVERICRLLTTVRASERKGLF